MYAPPKIESIRPVEAVLTWVQVGCPGADSPGGGGGDGGGGGHFSR